MLRFFKNGTELTNESIDRVRGLVYPALYVADGASVAFVFHEADFVQAPPSLKYLPLMESRDMI
jgi:hypothetical protein